MSLTRLLLTGRITDAEYFSALAGRGVPRPGWAHRRARIRQAAVELVSLAAGIIVVIFVVWAMAGASLPGDVR